MSSTRLGHARNLAVPDGMDNTMRCDAIRHIVGVDGAVGFLLVAYFPLYICRGTGDWSHGILFMVRFLRAVISVSLLRGGFFLETSEML